MADTLTGKDGAIPCRGYDAVVLVFSSMDGALPATFGSDIGSSDPDSAGMCRGRGAGLINAGKRCPQRILSLCCLRFFHQGLTCFDVYRRSTCSNPSTPRHATGASPSPR